MNQPPILGSVSGIHVITIRTASLWLAAYRQHERGVDFRSVVVKDDVAFSSGRAAGASMVSALGAAIFGLPDRFDPRRTLEAAAMLNAALTGGLLLLSPGSDLAVLLCFLTGAGFAGLYPVGMKIAVGWGTKDRGLLVGALVGALALGSATPHFAAWPGGAEWRVVIG